MHLFARHDLGKALELTTKALNVYVSSSYYQELLSFFTLKQFCFSQYSNPILFVSKIWLSFGNKFQGNSHWVKVLEFIYTF